MKKDNVTEINPKEGPPPPVTPKQELRFLVRSLYDIQRLRIATSQRDQTGQRRKETDTAPVQLTEAQQRFMDRMAGTLENLEQDADKDLKVILKKIPIWREWLTEQRGVGVRMGAIMIAEIDVHRAENPSKVWRYCGLAVDTETGRAERRKKGAKLKYNPKLKSKLLEVLGKSLIKAGAPLEAKVRKDGKKQKARDASEWYTIYVNRKHRRHNQVVDKCMGCGGTGNRCGHEY